ncbi:MAG TPA: flagellar motor protein [Gammaproteobacteria bacterium]|nr:flagellar motor protein [Gammaproteobacteria bacterium]
MDPLSIIGLIVGISAILLGQHLEGGHLKTLVNGPAALIVLGGTVGAVMLQSPQAVFLRAMRMLFWTVFTPRLDYEETIEKIIRWSNIARKEGLLGLEDVEEHEPDPFAQKALQLLIDGGEPDIIRGIMEVDIDTRDSFDTSAASVFESMGGYSPTIGIIGAVLGLIQVMGNLSDPSLLGSGIAVAFVATIYGVGAANLLFLPVAKKLKSIVHGQSQYREMIVEGMTAIAEGENPRNIETKLLGYLR